jgi:hypothetical protein
MPKRYQLLTESLKALLHFSQIQEFCFIQHVLSISCFGKAEKQASTTSNRVVKGTRQVCKRPYKMTGENC